jgi:NAD(P)-dependent dehydrogenase (short-subunit alcohol dehydrogenase family)
LSASNELAHERVCYVCKTPYKRLHHFYDQLCPTCAELNFKKREPRYDLRGRIALVTGARVKIGYYAALMLLRNGCDVIVTTRFPADAAQRFAREPDADVILPRLQVWGLDLRHTPSVDALARHLLATLPRLDFIIHNACQTVRRPPGFYAHLLDAEAEATRHPPRALGAVLEPWRAFAQAQAAQRLLGVSSSAALSQVGTEADAATLPATTAALAGIFPEGALDADLQQVDLRTHNSWRATLSEVPVTELLEVLLVNAAAPFVLTSKLVPLMKRDNAGKDRHVLNVSAMEGQFYRKKKTDKHPHTNMAKAALNMLTRTSAAELEPHGIWMNAVDTGWITDEDPAHIAQMKAKEHRFSPPLDVVDGAARIVDPIFDGLQTGTHRCGVFFKDYTPAPW